MREVTVGYEKEQMACILQKLIKSYEFHYVYTVLCK